MRVLSCCHAVMLSARIFLIVVGLSSTVLLVPVVRLEECCDARGRVR